MSKKNLLNESQVRQFMKLAKLEPLTPGFIHGLTEKQGAVDKEDEHLGAKDGPEKGKKQSMKDRRKEERGEDRAEGENPAAVEEVRTGTDPSPNLQSSRRGHGRGRYGDERLEEEEAPPGELETFATDDLEDDSLEGDEEAMDDELEADAELDAGGVEGRMVSVDDFLAALETALEDALGDEVEVDASDLEDDEVEADVELDAELDAGDEEVGIDVEDDEMLDEDQAYTAKKEKPGADKRKGAEKRGAEGTLAKTKGHGRVDYVDEGVFGMGKKEKEDRESLSPTSPERLAFDKKAGPESEDETARRRNRRPRRRATEIGGGGGMTIKGVTSEGHATDELIEQVTKRVAARILKTALLERSKNNT